MANVLSSAAAIGSRPRVADRVEAAARTDAMPWYVWSMLAAVTSVMTGEYWDISWHISVGRDTFWTPAHMLIQFAAVIAASSAGYLIFTTTFGANSKLRDA